MHAEITDIVPVHQGKFIKTYDFLLDDGRKYEVVSRKDLTLEKVLQPDELNSFDNADAVDIIAFSYDQEKMLIIKEWRYPVNDYVYAFPAGLRESGENVADTAKRELFEETGLEIDNVFDILEPAYQSVGMTDEAVATVICSVKGEITNKNATKDEDITPMWVTRDEARKLTYYAKISGRCQIVIAAWSWNAFFNR